MHPRHFKLKVVLFFCGLLTTGYGHSADKIVLVLLSKEQAEYQEVAENISRTLAQKPGVETRILPLTRFEQRFITELPLDMLVTVGAQAARQVARLNPQVPVLYTLLPRQTYLELERTENRVRRRTAIYLDQPLRRQLNLIGLALPEHTRVATILGPTTATLETELAIAARDRDLHLQTRRLSNSQELIPLLREVLEESDVLLSLPDWQIFNSGTIHHLLIATYHRKVPVVGFSRAFVEAGALLAVYSGPAQTGRQAAEIVQQALRAPARPLPPPQYPKYFTVAVNRRVAASLGIDVPDEQTLLNRLQEQPE